MSPKKSKKSGSSQDRQSQSSPAPAANKSKYFVDHLFRRHSISFIASPVYGGKTVLLLQIIRDWMAKLPIFGHESFPAPCCLVSNNPRADAFEAMERIGVEAAMLSTKDRSVFREKPGFDRVVEEAMRKVKGLQLLFIDGLPSLCGGNRNDVSAVEDFIGHITDVISERDLTVVGTGGYAKPKDHYSSSLDRFSGAYSWLEGSASYIALDPVTRRGSRDRRRKITIYSKYGPGEEFNYIFNSQGLLVEASALDLIDPFERYHTFDSTLLLNEPGTVIQFGEIVEIGQLNGLSPKTVQRRIKELQDVGYVRRIDQGKYRIERKQ